MPLRFPSVGRSLNSRGFSTPRSLCPIGQKQSERLTLAAYCMREINAGNRIAA